jgi:acetylornithine/N-succinyldiaminopimelate aminotransferase
VITLAKGLGSGVPIGACIAGNIAGEIFKPGNHASTFGGNPLACTAAITTLDVIEEEGLMCNALEQGDFMRKNFQEQLGDLDHVTQIRGQGLMIGIEFTKPCGELVKTALKQGLLINVTSDKVVRLLPSLAIKQNETEQIVNMVSTLIKEF